MANLNMDKLSDFLESSYGDGHLFNAMLTWLRQVYFTKGFPITCFGNLQCIPSTITHVIKHKRYNKFITTLLEVLIKLTSNLGQKETL